MKLSLMHLWLIPGVLLFINFDQGKESLPCNILEKIFLEKVFYDLPSLNLSYVDTITVLDKSNFFGTCNRATEINVDTAILNKPRSYDSLEIKSVVNKVIVIKNQDILPHPLMSGFWKGDKMLKDKYEDYFVMDQPEQKGNLILITLFRLGSNHEIFITYKIDKTQLILVDSEAGQY